MQRIASRIEAVTVYRAGALVSRVAALEAVGAELPRTVQILDLPLSLEDGSLRVRVEPADGEGGSEGSLPEASDVRVALDVPDPEGAPAPVEPESLRAARVEEERVRDEIAQVERALERLARLAVPPRPPGRPGRPPPPSPTAPRIELLAFRSARTRLLHERRRALHEELRRASEHRAVLEEREQRASTARQAKEHELRKSAVIRLRPGTARAARLVIEYLVPGARWAPSYTIRFDRALARAELAVRAVVCQRTGEDWNGVRLLLSTAQAQRWTELPELNGIRIGRAQPAPPRTGWRPAPTGVDALYADYDRAFGGPGRAPVPAAVPEPVPVPNRPRQLERGASTETAAFDEGHTTGKYDLAETDFMSEFDGDRTSPARPGLADAMETFREEQTEPARSMSSLMPPVPQGVAAPMPAAPARYAPAPMAEPEMMAMRKSRGGFGLGGIAGGISRAMAKKEAAPPGAYGGGGGEGGLRARDDEAPAPELRAAPELLAYGNLRMPPPADTRRGSLVRADDAEIYLELLAQLRVRVELDVFAAVGRAVSRARQVVRSALPPRHVAVRDEDGYDYAYRAEAPATIPSDDTFHALPLSQHQAAARPRYVVVPRETRDAFRFVEIDNPLSAPLLPGPADVYIGADFLVTTDVRATPPRGLLRLGLGVEQGIKVSRNTTFEEKTAGLMRGSLALRHEVRISVANRLDRPALVEVRERVPVSATEDDSDIDVAVIETRPAWQPYEQYDAPVRGGRRWEVEVAPGKDTDLLAVYEVRIAGKHELVGGNRREA